MMARSGTVVPAHSRYSLLALSVSVCFCGFSMAVVTMAPVYAGRLVKDTGQREDEQGEVRILREELAR